MFEDSLFASNSVSNPRRGWTALTSFFVQTLFIGVLVALPLLFTEALPLMRFSECPTVPLASEPPSVEQAIRHATRPLDSNIYEGRLVPPNRIPDYIVQTPDEPPPVGLGNGPTVPGSTNTNAPTSGFMTTLLNNIHPSVAHPSVANSKPVIVSRGVSEGLLIHQVKPTYPHLAIITHTQGEVILQAVIGKDGTIQNLRVVSGHPMLIKSAVDAVQQWRYRPYLLNGEPVEVETQVRVTFTIS